MRLLQLLCVAGLLALGGTARGAETPWRLEKDTDGIAVWTRSVDGSPHRALRARMVVETPLAGLVAIIRDTAACPEWAQFCTESYVHERVGPAEAYIYTRNDLPWPVADRDVLSHVTWRENPETGAVEMEAVATRGRLEPLRGLVRLTDARSTWSLRQLEDGGVEVTTFAHVDPAGPVPAWITNRLLVDAPFRTMERLRALAASGRWQADGPIPVLSAR